MNGHSAQPQQVSLFVEPAAVKDAVRGVLHEVFSDMRRDAQVARQEMLDIIAHQTGLLNEKQLCDWFGISDRTLARWRADGAPHVPGPGKSFMYDPIEFATWYKRQAGYDV